MEKITMKNLKTHDFAKHIVDVTKEALKENNGRTSQYASYLQGSIDTMWLLGYIEKDAKVLLKGLTYAMQIDNGEYWFSEIKSYRDESEAALKYFLEEEGEE